MTVRKKPDMSGELMLQVQRELGSIMEALRNGDESRADLIRRMDLHNDKLENMNGRMSNVEQSLRSQSTMLESITAKGLETRIIDLERDTRLLRKVLEDQLAFIDRMRLLHTLLGGGVNTIWKVALALIGSGLVGGSLVHLLHLG